MKRLTLTLVLLLGMARVAAAPVDQKQAGQVAANFWRAITATPLESVEEVSQTGFSTFYIFDINQGEGFVVVASDNVAYPILGYSTNSPAADMGPETRFWFGQYEAEIASIASGETPIPQDQQRFVEQQWQALLQGTWFPPKETTTVSQMLTTHWNQLPYYNALCPSGTPVGCVATAATQIMKFWNRPLRGTGSHSYSTRSYGTLSADFGNTVYDWDNMPNRLSSSSSSAQVMAVATLCYHFGVAVDMSYNSNGSGSQVLGSNSAETAFPTYFNYKNTLSGKYKRNFTDAEWVLMLKDELNNGRPVLYAGFDSEAGHAFVFDGYNSTNQFHVNWGWDGSYDGYFVVGALNPGGGGTGTNTTNTFNSNNQALIGIEPKATLSASKENLLFDVNGGTATLTIVGDHSNSANWNATSSASWLTLTPTTGAGNGVETTVHVTAAPTDASHPRSAIITVTHGLDTVLITVHQHTCSAEDLCSLTVNMTDAGSDGWDGAYLTFTSTTGTLFGKATLASGYYGTYTFPVCPDTVIVTWHRGQSDGGCAYFVENANGIMWLNHAQGDYILNTVDTIFSPCATTGGDTPHTYTLNVSSRDTTMGLVIGTDSNIHFGEVRTIQAAALDGHRFVRWSDNVYDNPRQVILTRNRTFTATFAELGEDTVQYDNGSLNTTIGQGNNFMWAIKINEDQLVGRPSITGIRFYCKTAGQYTVSVYQYGTESPLVRVYEKTENLRYTSAGKWCSVLFDTPVAINQSRPLWIVMKAQGVTTPAAIASWCGNDNGSWVSTDGGSTWGKLSEQDTPIYGTWMLRAIMPVDHNTYTLRVTSTRPTWGTVTGGGQFRYGQTTTIQAFPKEGYHFERWSDNNTQNPRTFSVKSDTVIRAFFAEGEVSISDITESSMSAYTEGRMLNLIGCDDLNVAVYDIMGRLLFAEPRHQNKPIALPSSGLYIVRVADKGTLRVIVY